MIQILGKPVFSQVSLTRWGWEIPNECLLVHQTNLRSYLLFCLPTQLQIIAASKCHIIIFYYDLLLQAAGSSLLKMAMSPPLGLQRHN